MDKPSPSNRDLARRLLAVEAAGQSAAGPRAQETFRVVEKLRASLTRFAGADGYKALLRRSLALAREEVPALQGVSENADGSVQGLEEVAAETGNSGAGDPAVAIIAHLLELLVIFVGEPITARLLREAWPDASLGN